MTATRHYLRRPAVAFVAACGVVLVMAGTAQAGSRCKMAGGPVAPCCAGAEGTCDKGCCGRSEADLSPAPMPADTGVTAPVGRSVLGTRRVPPTCHCGSGGPVAPDPRPGRPAEDDRSACDGVVASASSQGAFPITPAPPLARDVGDLLHRPLYVLTTHLRF